MKISYAVTVCDEFLEIQRLLTFLLKNKRREDQIVVLVDLTKNEPTSELLGYLHKLSSSNNITLVEDRFNNHFADWKNKLTDACSGDYIFQIDADEMVSEEFMEMLPQILEVNQIDLIRMSRINTVEGLTQEHIQKWGWRVNDKGWVNFPDPQGRIYRNDPSIRWENKVHEVLVGCKTLSHLPTEEEFCLLHPKTIERQEKQNNFYSEI